MKNLIKIPILKAAGMPSPKKPTMKPATPKLPGAGGGKERQGHKYLKRERSKQDPTKWIYFYRLPDGSVTKKVQKQEDTQQVPQQTLGQLPQEKPNELPKQQGQMQLNSEEVKTYYPEVPNPESFKAALPPGVNYYDLTDVYKRLQDTKKKLMNNVPSSHPQFQELNHTVNELIAGLERGYGKDNLLGKQLKVTSQKEVEGNMTPSGVQNWLNSFNEKVNSGTEPTMDEISKYNKLSKKLEGFYANQEDKRVTERLEKEESDRAQLAKDNINKFINKVPKKKKFNKGIETNKLPESETSSNKKVEQKLISSVDHTLGILFKDKNSFKIKKIIPGQKSYSVIVDLKEGTDRNKLGKYNNFTKLNGKVINNSDGTVSIQFLNNSIKNTFKIKDMEERNKIGLKSTIESIQRQALESYKMRGFKGALMSLGVDSQGKPITIDLANDNINNLATLGLPGGGKSYSMINGLLSLASVYDPEEIQFDLVDGGEKSTTFNNIDKDLKKYLASNTIHGVKDKEGVSEFIKKINGTLQEMANRGEIMSQTGVDKITELPSKEGKQLPIRMFVVDELQALYSTIDSLYPVKEAKDIKQEITGKLSRIQTGGRKYGIKSWILGQTLDHSDKNFGYLKPLFGRADVKTQLRSNRSSAQAFTGRYAYANPNSPQGLAQIFSPDRDAEAPYTADTPDRTQDEKIILEHAKTK